MLSVDIQKSSQSFKNHTANSHQPCQKVPLGKGRLKWGGSCLVRGEIIVTWWKYIEQRLIKRIFLVNYSASFNLQHCLYYRHTFPLNWAERGLYHSTPAVTRDIAWWVLIRRTVAISTPLKTGKGFWRPRLTWISTGRLYKH